MMEAPVGRKLISLLGFKGFVDQLAPDEFLILERLYDDKTIVFSHIETARDYRSIYFIQGTYIRGFWAVQSNQWKVMHKTVKVVPLDDFPIRTTVRRPVEDLVLSAIMESIPALEYLTGVINWTTRDFI